MDPRKVYLAQTDTTVGFLSQDGAKLARIKKRPPNKPFLIALCSFALLQSFVRVPGVHRKRVRRAKKITFIYPNGKALRLVKETEHYRFLRKFGWMYSTSANESGRSFERSWASKQADIVVEDSRGLYEASPSPLYRLGKKRLKRLR